MANTEKTEQFQKTIRIEGMMCQHCEMHVKKALEALPEVDEAIPSHKDGAAELKLNAPVSDEALAKAVADAGYKYLG